jgi:hypothetical protein
MPSSQAFFLCLKEAIPDMAERVLALARQYEQEAGEK